MLSIRNKTLKNLKTKDPKIYRQSIKEQLVFQKPIISTSPLNLDHQKLDNQVRKLIDQKFGQTKDEKQTSNPERLAPQIMKKSKRDEMFLSKDQKIAIAVEKYFGSLSQLNT